MEDATEIEQKRYKNFRNMYNRTKRAMMKKYYSDKSSEYRTNTKKLWELMNSVIGKNKNRGCSISHLTIDGFKIFNNKMIAEEFAKFYSNLGESLASKITPGIKPADHYLSLIPKIVNSLVLSETNVTEIEKIIDRLPNKASSGYDGVSNILLKKLGKSLSYPLGIIFNQSIATGCFPDRMKVAEIIPLYKGREEDQVVNYRPVSLLMTTSKILEKIIYNRVSKFLTKYNILYDSQYGFRSKHSCEDAILELIGRVLQSKNDDKYCAGIFLDLSKAFDTLDHHLLLQKMEKYGIRGSTLDWFKSYLSNRSILAKIIDSNRVYYSKQHPITYGTAQGSCLGPLLFIIFCNDIYRFDLYGSLILFADDTTLISTNKSQRYLEFQMQHDMTTLMDWFKANKLSLNLTKSVMIRFWNEDSQPGENLDIHGLYIPEVDSTKFLGIHLDKNLSWDDHITQLVNKLNRNRYLLNISKKLLYESDLTKLYYAHIYSHIKYGITAWGSMIKKSQLNNICNVQKKCIKSICKQSTSANIQGLLKGCRLLNVQDVVELELSKFGYRLSKDLLPKPLKQLMEAKGGKKLHRYPTRNKSLPNIQKHFSTIFNCSFMCRSLIIYNQTPQQACTKTSVRSFAKFFKEWKLEAYK